MVTKENIKIEDKNGLAFIKEVAKYFMNFLETDFHKRKNPKRSIQFRSSNNLLVGLNLNKYPSFVCCQGCKDVSFRSNSMCSEDINYDPETGEQSLDENVGLYPNRLAGRKQVKDMYLLPEEVLKIYKETHGPLCGQLNILAGIGISALVESVCREKEAQGGNLKNKIDDLVTKGVLTRDSAETLHSTRLLGNNSQHTIQSPQAMMNLISTWILLKIS